MLDVANAEFLLSCTDVNCLERRIDGFETKDPSAPAVHPAGHFGVGGLQNDPFASPGDPAFYLIHAQIDRLWSIWQAQDPANRLNQVGGTKKPLDRGKLRRTDRYLEDYILMLIQKILVSLYLPMTSYLSVLLMANVNSRISCQRRTSTTAMPMMADSLLQRNIRFSDPS